MKVVNGLISIIVPVYNVEAYLNKCIETMVCQTYKNLEIILVDDGSKDNSPKICDEWAKKDSRIKVIHTVNGGASAARNRALDVATGDYIGFVDSDDFIHPKMYEKLINALKNSSKKICCCKFRRIITDNPNISTEETSTSETLDLAEAIDGVFYEKIDLSVWSKLFEKDVFDNVRFPVGEVNEEAPIMLPMLIKSNGIELISDELYFYCEHPNSVTASYWKTNADIMLKNFSRIYNQLSGINMHKAESFKFYVGKTSFSIALQLDKNYHRINAAAKQNFAKYLQVMRKLSVKFMLTNKMSLKNKILYLMIITRTLRPIYKIIGKK